MKFPSRTPETGFYYHYKHNPLGRMNNYAYEVLGVGIHTEEDCRPEDANMVVYRPLYSIPENPHVKKSFFLRPSEGFFDIVTKGGSSFSRFTKITDAKVIADLEAIRSEFYSE